MSKRHKARLIPSGTPLGGAENLRRTTDSKDYRQSVLTEKELMGIVLPERKWVLEDLITEESMTILNGFRGFGKSWLALAMADAVTVGGKVGPWSAPQPLNTMIVDGEMPLVLLQKRLRALRKGNGRKRAELFFYPEAYAYRIGLKRANILDATWRDRVGDTVKDLGIRFLVLDNMSSLAPGIDENDKMPFDPVNRWLLEMRFSGVAIVMAHHTGKTGDQRGTSAHEDHVDTALLLGKPNGWSRDMGCTFTVEATKDRDHIVQGAKYTLTLVAKEGEKAFFRWSGEGEKGSRAIQLITEGGTYKDAEKEGISNRAFYRAKKRAEGNK